MSEDLEARVAQLEQQVAELQEILNSDADADSPGTGVIDPRDSAVIETIDERGLSEVTLRQLQKLYRAKTDVRNKNTLKSRIKSLTQDGPFELCGPQRWRYTRGDD